MSALVLIVCDRCEDTGGTGVTPQQARAAVPGWTRRHGQDFCPLCRITASRSGSPPVRDWVPMADTVPHG